MGQLVGVAGCCYITDYNSYAMSKKTVFDL